MENNESDQMVDLISNLPIGLAMAVFRKLGYHSLYRASRVSDEWMEIIQRNTFLRTRLQKYMQFLVDCRTLRIYANGRHTESDAPNAAAAGGSSEGSEDIGTTTFSSIEQSIDAMIKRIEYTKSMLAVFLRTLLMIHEIYEEHINHNT